ncbi:12769_t:CDS:10 [Funneliformis mosseae]|uniref:Telomerase reverse transcriptase n=1 Tax=Funneliformis mosseae TaxID=27381 RepID=A0A9N8V287_FUNMO|nr:12769_t:CDS:10 [Funneliformis mosseae]
MSTINNTTLKAYYSNLTFLLDFLRLHHDENVELLKEEDESEYKKLLRNTVITADTTQSFPRITREQQDLDSKRGSGLDSTINQAIAILVNRSDKKSTSNVVRFGFARPKALNLQGFRLTGINSTVDYMRKSRAWLKLYMRIGHEPMIFLLTNFSIFLELQNGCYVQLAGQAISNLPIPQSLPSSKNKKRVSEVGPVPCPQISTSSPSQTQDGYSYFQSSSIIGSQNVSQNDLTSDRTTSWKSMLSQDINPISKRRSDVLTFFRKLHEEENKAFSQSYDSMSSLPSQTTTESSSQNDTLFSSQSTYETSSQITTLCSTSSEIDMINDANESSSISKGGKLLISNDNASTGLNDKVRTWIEEPSLIEAMLPNKEMKEEDIENESMKSISVEPKIEDTSSNYAKFKEQTKGMFLKIMDAMHSDKKTRKEDTESYQVGVSDESTMFDENKNPMTPKKRPIENVQENSYKAIILNNHEVVKVSTISRDVKETKDIISNVSNVDNELAVSNEDNYLKTQRKRSIEDANQNKETSSKAIVLNDRKVLKISNTVSLSSLCFSRSIMFFSSPTYNNNGLCYGLPKEHILNVAKFSKEDVMLDSVTRHIFPRQFGLRNAFINEGASSPDSLHHIYINRKLNDSHYEIPDRLQHILPYVDRIIKHHKLCHYKNLLDQNCPIQVAKFVKSVLDFIIPLEFWGGKNNKTVIYKMVKVIIERRRFEALSMHEVLLGFKIKECQWLVPPGGENSCNKVEALKRSEILHEFVWWTFECVVIPLLKINFHITHSITEKYRLFYYRQEVWSEMSKRSIEPLLGSVFEEIPSEIVPEILEGKTLGCSEVRFVPKDNKGKLRPIVNMRRPMCKNVDLSSKTTRQGSKKPQSINAILNTTFQILKHEKQNLVNKVNNDNFELYFAKVDVKCCFESIDHNKLMEIIHANVFTEIQSQYVVNRYEMVHPKGGEIRRRNGHYVHNGEEFVIFPKYANELAQRYKNAILVENVRESYKDLGDVLDQLEEHIQHNVIKSENKYYLQRVGIPQGSILSSLLCSIYYGVMERSELLFVKDNDGVLLHYIDDFLYISTNKEDVIKFITTMHKGQPEYRCIINKNKSMVNFDLEISDEIIKKADNFDFPWCGLLLNTRTLNIKADYSRYLNTHISNILNMTIKKGSHGEFLKHKMLESVTTKCHHIFYDASLNTKENILLNIYQNFLMAAMKFHNYVKGMSRQGSQQNEEFEAEVVHNTFDSAYRVLNKYSRCTFKKEEIVWLGAYAFRHILEKKVDHRGVYHQGVLVQLEKLFKDSQVKSRLKPNEYDKQLSQ